MKQEEYKNNEERKIDTNGNIIRNYIRLKESTEGNKKNKQSREIFFSYNIINKFNSYICFVNKLKGE